MSLPGTVDAPARRALSWGLVPAVLVCGAAILLFGLQVTLPGYALLVVGVGIAYLLDRSGRTEGLARDLLLIAIGQAIVSTISVEADISYGNMALMGTVLALAVAVPYVISRYVYRDHAIRFPWRTGKRWTRVQWTYLIGVTFVGWLVLPFYFITSGVYRNWPTVTEFDEFARLFVGVNAVGTWDELFFICTIFALLRRHFPVWQANLLQTIVFVSFLWELGYQSWGPLLTIPFALIQGYTFTLTKSLTYVLTVHLLFDLVVFLVIVYAHNGWPPIFLLAP
ncbi:CPBP family glutamic-type intramembrane protease [Agromyces atrinae]|uniref:CPBP family intramembrane metalloprotease n=1 Tax=Agromyces atrinae TaxID=592376 RepID=A0A4Q2M799_9MICO|nr:CPBP family glutamic-type intramembrane protease [Agromyces atrinae]NYD65812.1 membrane protease YdiL (CAAX protease family) [Agromyces atrinae]RXZ86163.1 CPBP family intramembrane metalloprotease [Agromyces atrinae]